jgi:hypothetical protein
MSIVNTYNPSDVYLIIAGHICTGWNEISIEKSTSTFKFIKGIRGKNTRVKDLDTSAIINITLLQTSQTNDILSEIHKLDIEEGTGRLEIALVDKSGTTAITSIEAYILTYPNKSFKDEFEPVSWSIQCQSTNDYIIGGNTSPETSVISSMLSQLGIN